MPTRSHFPRARTALVLVDTINPFDFPGGAAFARRSLPVARAIAALRDRASRARVPVVYVNDNLGRWRSDLQGLIERCLKPGTPGAPIVDMLAPRPSDYVILKATLSGDEPVDVKNFALGDPTFPHDSTGNQFFDEARFESYRTLGFHTVLTVADGLRDFPNVEALCDAARKSLAEIEVRATPTSAAPV